MTKLLNPAGSLWSELSAKYLRNCSLLIMLLLWLAGISYAQNGGFNMVYSNPAYGSIRFDHIVYSNDTLTVMGTYGDDSVMAFGILVAQFDTLGNILRSEVMVDSSLQVHYITNPRSQILRCRSQGYAIPAYAFGRSNPILLKINHKLQVDQLHEYEHTDKLMSPNQVVEVQKGHLLFGRIQRENFNIMTFVLRIDEDGNELWRKFYGDSRYDSYFGKAIKTGENEIVIGSQYALPTDHFTPLEDEWSQPWIFAIDTNGVEQWEWVGEKGDGLGWIADNLVQSSDLGWVYTPNQRELFEIYPTVFESRYSPLLVKRDSLFESIWQRNYDTGPHTDWTFFRDMVVTENNDFVIVGQRGDYFPDIAAVAGRVVKAGFNGEQTWEVVDTGVFGPMGSRNYLTGVAVSPTGSIYCSGYADPLDGETTGWLIKVTKDGCIDTLCTTTSIKDLLPVQSSELHVWPNPASEYIDINVPAATSIQYNFTLVDVLGAVVLDSPITGQPGRVDLSGKNIGAGTYSYFVREYAGGRLIGSGKLIVVR